MCVFVWFFCVFLFDQMNWTNVVLQEFTFSTHLETQQLICSTVLNNSLQCHKLTWNNIFRTIGSPKIFCRLMWTVIAWQIITEFLQCRIFQREQNQEVFNDNNTLWHYRTVVPWTSSTSTPTNLLLICKFLDLHLDLGNCKLWGCGRASVFNKPFRGLCCMLKFENHC